MSALLAGVALNEDGLEQANMGVALGDYLHTGPHVLADFAFRQRVRRALSQ